MRFGLQYREKRYFVYKTKLTEKEKVQLYLSCLFVCLYKHLIIENSANICQKSYFLIFTATVTERVFL